MPYYTHGKAKLTMIENLQYGVFVLIGTRMDEAQLTEAAQLAREKKSLRSVYVMPNF